MLSILSWNIQQGGGSRYLKIIDAIKAEAAHIVVLSEFRNNAKGKLILAAINKMGYSYFIHPSNTGSKNTVLLASKIDFLGSWFPNCDQKYSHSIVKGSFEAFDLYGCYLPHKKRHRLIGFLEEEISKSQKPAIIVGDINTGINGLDQKGNSFWYQDELKSLFDSGIKDAFRIKNGDRKEYSWFSHQGNGFRYDHSYVSEILASIVRECHYLHAYREQKYADHSPMILSLA